MSYMKPVYPKQAFTVISSGRVSPGLQRHSLACRGRQRRVKVTQPCVCAREQQTSSPPLNGANSQEALAAPSIPLSILPSVSPDFITPPQPPRLGLTWLSQQRRLACLLISGGVSTAGEHDREKKEARTARGRNQQILLGLAFPARLALSQLLYKGSISK